jgi:hypothetical protein
MQTTSPRTTTEEKVTPEDKKEMGGNQNWI